MEALGRSSSTPSPAPLVKGPWQTVKAEMLRFYGERQERRAAG